MNNPLIQKYAYSSFRKRQIWIYATIYFSVIIVLLFINYSLYFAQQISDSSYDFFKSLFYQFVTFQVLILWLWGSFNSSSAIKEEILEKSYDFFRMLPIPAGEKAVGILIGKNLVPLLMAGINFIFVIGFGILGRVNFLLQIEILVLLLSVGVLANSYSLLSSVCTVPKKKNSNVIVLIFIAFFTAPYLFGGIYQLSESDGVEVCCVKFFGLGIPILLLISLIAAYFSAWAFKGVIRKFNKEYEPLFTKKGAFLFAIGYELIAFGLFVPHLMAEKPIEYFFWAVTLIPAVLVMIGALKNQEHYIEYSRAIDCDKSSDNRSMLPMLSFSNLSVGFGLFVIWAIFAVCIVVVGGGNLLENLHSVLILFSSYLFVILLVEIYSIYKSSNPKMGLLVGFVIILFFLLSVVFGNILEIDTLVCYSPFGYIGNLLFMDSLETGASVGIWIVNFLLCIIPARVILGRYRLILNVRESMSSAG